MIANYLFSNPMIFFSLIFIFFIYIIVKDDTLLRMSNSSRKIYLDG